VNTQWGAPPEAWAHFVKLGFLADLLPVVSNPEARISPLSTLKGLGKTPSVYNRDGLVIGVGKWTDRQTTAEDVARWSANPDYGICVQTRRLRAIDIDVDDHEKAHEIARHFERSLGKLLARRWRKNSGKCLLAFTMPGDFHKRSFKVEGGLVEFLANGQQFVAVGTHPSGARYEWDEV
jgi:hypothetical protein